jgi:manganese/zinc/iron transport system permease protein
MLVLGDFWQAVFWDNYTIWMVSLGSCILGVVSGALGTFAVLRRQSLLGDAISHSALAGLALAYLLTNSRSTFVLLLGAGLAGWISTLLFLGIIRSSRIKEDAALGTVLSVLFGLGLMLHTYIINNDPDAAQVGLDKFLFGQAATMLTEDIAAMLLLGGAAGVLLLAFWKEFKLLSFDPEFGSTLGLPLGRMEVLLTGLLVLAIIIGLQAVGVVLMSALLIAPAAAARQWTDRLGRMVLLAMFFGALAGSGGALSSSFLSTTTPTGPTIVLLASAIVFISLTLAPNRGLVWNWLAQRARHRQLRLEAVLGDLYDLAAQHEFREHAHAVAVLRAMGPSRGDVPRTLQQLAALGWARRIGDDWTLTPEGKTEAQRRLRLSARSER